MQYTFYAVKDNAEAQLDSNIGASTLSIILGTGQGALFPQPYSGTTTSLGSSTLLNKTGIGASGIAVGDYIENTTDGSHAFVTAVNTDSLTTSELQAGSDNTWQNADAYQVNAFIGTLNKRNVDTGAITSSEKVKITGRSGDSLTVGTGTRGFDGSVAASFDAGDYFNVFVVSKSITEIRKALTDLSQQTDLKASLAYVQTLFAARLWKDPVRVATTGAGTLATSFENGDTIDGIVLATGNRILIKNQAAPAENGIYIVAASGAPVRATDFDATSEVTSAAVSVSLGTSNADTIWLCTSDSPVIGVDSINFTQLATGLVKASSAEAITGTDDSKYVTSLGANLGVGEMNFGGTGADGDLTISSGTTTLNLGQVYNFANFVNNGTLAFTGSGIACVNIRGNASGNGTIELRNSLSGASVATLTRWGTVNGGNAPTAAAPNAGGTGGAGGVGTAVGGAGGAGGTSTNAGSGTAGAAGSASSGVGGDGGGGGSAGGGGGGGGGGGVSAGTIGSAASGNNGGAGGAGGASTSGADRGGGGGGGGGGGYLTGNGGAGAVGGAELTGVTGPVGGGSGGNGGASGATGGTGGAGGNGGANSSAGGSSFSGRTGNGGAGGWGYSTAGNGGNAGNYTFASGVTYTTITMGAGGAGGTSTYGTGGNGGTGGALATSSATFTLAAVPAGGAGGDGRVGGTGGRGLDVSGTTAKTGGNGGAGGHAKNGCAALVMLIRGTNSATWTVNGQGGNGGTGGAGGTSNGAAANSNGGNGGNAGRGADVFILCHGAYSGSVTVNNTSGTAGAGGAAGTGGGGAAGAAGSAGTTPAASTSTVAQLLI